MHRRGFALVEILLVLVIVALFAGGGFYIKNIVNQQNTLNVGTDAIKQATEEQQQAQASATEEQNLINQFDSSGVSAADPFPMPAPYAHYAWKSASSSYDALYLTPASNFNGSLSGQLYEATNTDPSAKAWEQMNAAAPKDQPEGFYSGDQSFLVYYDEALEAEGYQTSPLNLGKYSFAPISADGPHGTIRGYIKYNGGKIRVVIVSSNDTENQVFVGDIIDPNSLIK